MIRSSACKHTRRVFQRTGTRRFPADIQQRAFARLNALDSATRLEDLRLPPSNRLEALRGDRAGQWILRINKQWRICFRWADGNAHDVQIVDYH